MNGEEPSLNVNLAGLKLANPMMTASGTCGYCSEYADLLDLSRLGAFVTKTITAKPRKGNEAYRIVETRGGMLNAIGLANVGLEVFLKEKLPQLRQLRASGPRIIVNIAGHDANEFAELATHVSAEDDIDAIELNVSCPNVAGGLDFGTNPDLLEPLVAKVRQSITPNINLIVKLSPNVGDICQTARAAINGGANILSMINTYTALTVDVYHRRPRLANGTGGLSGPAIRPLAVYLVNRVYQNVARQANVPIIAMGGIQYWQDAAEFILAGASALAVGTGLFINPATPTNISDQLVSWLSKLGYNHLEQAVGSLQMPTAATDTHSQ